MKYKIGDRITVLEWDSMPESFRIKKDGTAMTARGKCCGKSGSIKDILVSESEGTLYRITTDDGYTSSILYREEWISSERKPIATFCCRYEEETQKLFVSVLDDKGNEETAYGFVTSDTLEGYVSAFSFATYTLNDKIKRKKENKK